MNIQSRFLLSGNLIDQLTHATAAPNGPPKPDPRTGTPFVSGVGRLNNGGSGAGPGASANPGREARAEKARQIQESGALGAGESPKPKEPVVTDADRKAMGEIVAKASDDVAVALSGNAKAMAAASPEQKAQLIKKLMDGHTSDSEDRAIAAILKSCTSKAEYDKVLEMAGGKKAVFEELDDKGAKNLLAGVDAQWSKAQAAATNSALLLLEECEDPDEARELAAQLGATQLKHQIKDPAQLRRLEAMAQRFQMPALSYGLPAEVVEQKRGQISRAVNKEDSALAAQLAEDRDAMKTASPAEKAALIRELGRGWTKDREDVAVYKILSSCTSKAEFDEVMQLAGGRGVLGDMDEEETRTKMNELCGAWGRTDLASDPARAAKFQNVLADPVRQAELSAVRPPSAAEAQGVGGEFHADPKWANDPAMQQANAAMGTVRGNIQKKAFDVDWDPQAKNELVLEQRRREIEGRPKLDLTAITAAADRITSDPDFTKKVAAFQIAHNQAKPLDQIDAEEAREKYVESQMNELRKQHGLSEQTMKALVTQRMGQIYSEGAGEAKAYQGALLEPLKQQLKAVEAAQGPQSAEAAELRERIAKIEATTGAYASHLSAVGEVHKNLYKVPPSFAESFVAAFQVIADIAAAVVSCVPGVGNAIGAAYFGVKAIVAAAKGDLLGVFSSVASAIPGVGAAIGGATGKAISLAGRLTQSGIGAGQSIAEGNILGAISSIGGAAGNLLGPLAKIPAVQSITQNPVVKEVAGHAQNAIPFFQAVAEGDVTRALGAVAGGLSPLAAMNPQAQQALGWVTDGARTVEAIRTGAYGQAIAGLTDGFGRLGVMPEGAAFASHAGQVPAFLGAVSSGDPAQLARVLSGTNGQPGFLAAIGAGGISEAVTGISSAAGGLLASPQAQAAFELTRAGSNFLGQFAAGDPYQRLLEAMRPGDPAAAQVRELAALCGPATPLFRSMAQGDFSRALEQLRSHPQTAGAAEGLAALAPLAELAQPGWQEVMGQTKAQLTELAGLPDRLGPLPDLEEAVRQLNREFRGDANAIARHLLAGLAQPDLRAA